MTRWDASTRKKVGWGEKPRPSERKPSEPARPDRPPHRTQTASMVQGGQR